MKLLKRPSILYQGERNKNMDNTAVVTRKGLLDMQVCVPKKWTNKKVKEFAETEFPCGTSTGWGIRKQGDELLAGNDERVTCHDREDFVHITLDA